MADTPPQGSVASLREIGDSVPQVVPTKHSTPPDVTSGVGPSLRCTVQVSGEESVRDVSLIIFPAVGTRPLLALRAPAAHEGAETTTTSSASSPSPLSSSPPPSLLPPGTLSLPAEVIHPSAIADISLQEVGSASGDPSVVVTLSSSTTLTFRAAAPTSPSSFLSAWRRAVASSSSSTSSGSNNDAPFTAASRARLVGQLASGSTEILLQQAAKGPSDAQASSAADEPGSAAAPESSPAREADDVHSVMESHFGAHTGEMKLAQKRQIMHEPAFLEVVDALSELLLYLGHTREKRGGRSRVDFRKTVLAAIQSSVAGVLAGNAAVSSASPTPSQATSATATSPTPHALAAGAGTSSARGGCTRGGEVPRGGTAKGRQQAG
jgi:hypothetical protein